MSEERELALFGPDRMLFEPDRMTVKREGMLVEREGMVARACIVTASANGTAVGHPRDGRRFQLEGREASTG